MMTAIASEITDALWAALGGPPTATRRVRFTGGGALPSTFALTDFAASTFAVAGLALSELIAAQGLETKDLRVDRMLASAWYTTEPLRPIGWSPKGRKDPLTDQFVTADDRWLRFQNNYPHLRDAALRVLGVDGEREAVAAAVRHWTADELESAVVAGGGACAVGRTSKDWQGHPQGAAVSREPLVAFTVARQGLPTPRWHSLPERPLAGLRVLDLTRVLAGPMATRFLAGYGAEVLRIDPVGYQEPGGAGEPILGKRSATLDLRTAEGRADLLRLLAGADVLVHGYRPGALDALGLGPEVRAEAAPGCIEVTLNAYGWTGPWAERRGFDTLVQMSNGIAAHSGEVAGEDRPLLMPVQALDMGTGYLMAAAVLRLLMMRLQGQVGHARFSLARTGEFLKRFDQPAGGDVIMLPLESPLAPGIVPTPFGPARRLQPPLELDGTPLHWDRPGDPAGSAVPVWVTTRERWQ